MDLTYLPFILVLIIIPILELDKTTKAESDVNVKYQNCNKTYSCGNINFTYPFYDGKTRPAYCGPPQFYLSCNADQQPVISTYTPGISYHLTAMNSSLHTVSVVINGFLDGGCPTNATDSSLYMGVFNYPSKDETFSFHYECGSPNSDIKSGVWFACPTDSNLQGYITSSDLERQYGSFPQDLCQYKVTVPVNKSVNISDVNNLQDAFDNSIELEWNAENDSCDKCRGGGGECGWDQDKKEFACYCPATHPNCYRSPKSNKYIILGVILAASATGTGILIVVICYFRRIFLSQCDGCGLSQANLDVEAFLKAHGSLAPKRYNYEELKKITKSFKEKLGEGSFGTVYKGELHNHHLVAVKLLKKSEGNAQEFINEVASIGRTNHVNVVTLLGFCFHGNKKALVYDYMPNGSLEKFIHRGNNQQTLSFEKLFQIAVGIARGLEYLHQGCNTRILHFDIKPHNILLDGNFCPKISDFGLARSCTQQESIISISGVRGTAGFIAPEVFLKGFGRVSDKSDVYSYGMLVLEMMGCKKGAKLEVDNGSEECFPQWIYRELEQEEEVDNQGIENAEDKVLQKKMIVVSLWCIQTHPSSRPSMTRVVEMLEGAIESIQHPPEPTLFSPLISFPNSSNLNTISS